MKSLLRSMSLREGGDEGRGSATASKRSTTIRSVASLTSSLAAPTPTQLLVSSLETLDTACLCDADRAVKKKKENCPPSAYTPLKLMTGLVKRSSPPSEKVMVGIAKTIKCLHKNDLLAILDGLMQASEGDVLVIDSSGSNQALAGEILVEQAMQSGLAGIILDGPMRDVRDAFGIWNFSRSVTPYAGTILHLGELNTPVNCGGVQIESGDIIVGDDDGLVALRPASAKILLPIAKQIKEAEQEIKRNLVSGEKSLNELTNLQQHIDAVKNGDLESTLNFI